MDGILLVDKPVGVTSAEVVRRIKHRLRAKTGHLGTLDPFASGVLPICLGEGTKLAQFLSGADKTYTGSIHLGSATDTGDPTGRVTGCAPVPLLSDAAIAAAAAACSGERLQTPPMYSAIKHQGTPLYKLARRGIEIARAPRRVYVAVRQLRCVAPETLDFVVDCSKGTYVRVVAEEIAAALGTLGHLACLCRTRFGRFTLEQAIPLEAIAAGTISLLRLRDCLAELREIVIDAAAAQRARQGFEPLLLTLSSGRSHETVKLVDPDGELAAVIVSDDGGRWRFGRVFPHATQAGG